MKRALPIILITTVVVLLFYFLTSGPDKYNWNKTLRTNDDNPYGCKITFAMLPDIFTKGINEIKNTTIAKTEGYESYQLDEISSNQWDDDDIYNTDEEEKDEFIVDYTDDEQDDTFSKGNNYAVITLDFMPGDYESKSLLYHAQKGNDVLLAAENFSPIIRNELDFGVNNYFETDDDSISINIGPNDFSKWEDYKYKKGTVNFYISFFDSKTSEIIARNNHSKPVLMKVKYGKGNLYICTIPNAFSNYNVLDTNNQEFVSLTLSHLSNRKLNWISQRDYRKYNPDMQSFTDNQNRDLNDNSPSKLEFLKENPPLWWAFIMIIITGIIFILFGAKRKQRTIPVVKPLQNSTIAFVNIIADLYFQKGDHKNVASKKISFFLEYIRTSFFVKTIEFNEDMFRKISERSGVSTDKVQHLFNSITTVRNKKQISQTELLTISNLLESFKKESKI